MHREDILVRVGGGVCLRGGEDLVSLCRYFESRVTRSEGATPGGRKTNSSAAKLKPKRSSIAIPGTIVKRACVVSPSLSPVLPAISHGPGLLPSHSPSHSPCFMRPRQSRGRSAETGATTAASTPDVRNPDPQCRSIALARHDPYSTLAPFVSATCLLPPPSASALDRLDHLYHDRD
jgi:hypothetical protein